MPTARNQQCSNCRQDNRRRTARRAHCGQPRRTPWPCKGGAVHPTLPFGKRMKGGACFREGDPKDAERRRRCDCHSMSLAGNRHELRGRNLMRHLWPAVQAAHVFEMRMSLSILEELRNAGHGILELPCRRSPRCSKAGESPPTTAVFDHPPLLMATAGDAICQPRPYAVFAVDPPDVTPHHSANKSQSFARWGAESLTVPSFLSCRRSRAASPTSQSRKVTIFGSVVVAFGQMIQYVLDRRSSWANGRSRRPLIRSVAARVVRARTMPWPSTAASMAMLTRLS